MQVFFLRNAGGSWPVEQAVTGGGVHVQYFFLFFLFVVVVVIISDMMVIFSFYIAYQFVNVYTGSFALLKDFLFK